MLFREVSRHGKTHGAKADECDLHSPRFYEK
jgi:hypothetical protein